MPSDDLNRLSDNISLFGNADPLIGNVLGGRWEVLAFIGEGSMSSAYKARDVQTGTRVVLKMLHQHLVANNKNLKRFEQRAKTFMMLMNEKVARVFDVQLTPEGGVFIVVEQLLGESLEDLLAKSGHLSADHAIDVFMQVCEGLEYAHDQDVLHRDLKPSNIMLVETGGLTQDVKLVDFGVAKLLSEESDDVRSSGYITRTREVFGSPMYMSPEQCMGKRLDGRSDIYSLGCVMYETLTGKPPFVGKNVLETAYKHMNEQPKSFSSDRPADRALGRFESVIFKCLAKDPNERYQSVSQLKSDLQMMPIASELDWTSGSYALQKLTKAKAKGKPVKEKGSGGVGMPDLSGLLSGLSGISLPSFGGGKKFISFEVGIFVGVSLLLAIVVGVWSFTFIGQENQEYPDFNNDLLWVVREKRTPAPPPNFGTQEEAAKIDLSTIENEKGVDSREYAIALYNLGKLYLGAGRWSDAVTNLSKLIETTKKTGAPAGLPTEYANLSFAYFMAGQTQEAELAATNAMEEAERAGLSSQPVVLTPLKVLGDIYSQKNQLDKATDVYEKLYNIVEPRKYQAAQEFQYAAAWLGDVYRRQDKLDYAERYYRQALEMTKNSGNYQNLFTVKVLYGLGMVLAKEGNNKEAEQCFREGLPMAQQMAGPRSAIAGAMKKRLTEVLWKTNWWAAIMSRVNDQPPKDSQNPDDGAAVGVQ